MYEEMIFEKSNIAFKELTGIEKRPFTVMANLLSTQYQEDHKCRKAKSQNN